jgi:hypothetical protein
LARKPYRPLALKRVAVAGAPTNCDGPSAAKMALPPAPFARWPPRSLAIAIVVGVT